MLCTILTRARPLRSSQWSQSQLIVQLQGAPCSVQSQAPSSRRFLSGLSVCVVISLCSWSAAASLACSACLASSAESKEVAEVSLSLHCFGTALLNSSLIGPTFLPSVLYGPRQPLRPGRRIWRLRQQRWWAPWRPPSPSTFMPEPSTSGSVQPSLPCDAISS